MSPQTANVFSSLLSSAKAKSLSPISFLTLLCECQEFANTPVRHSEDIEMPIVTVPHLPLPMPFFDSSTAQYKTHLLLQLQMTRNMPGASIPVPCTDFYFDQKQVMAQVPRLVAAFMSVCVREGCTWGWCVATYVLQCLRRGMLCGVDERVVLRGLGLPKKCLASGASSCGEIEESQELKERLGSDYYERKSEKESNASVSPCVSMPSSETRDKHCQEGLVLYKDTAQKSSSSTPSASLMMALPSIPPVSISQVKECLSVLNQLGIDTLRKMCILAYISPLDLEEVLVRKGISSRDGARCVVARARIFPVFRVSVKCNRILDTEKSVGADNSKMKIDVAISKLPQTFYPYSEKPLRERGRILGERLICVGLSKKTHLISETDLRSGSIIHETSLPAFKKSMSISIVVDMKDISTVHGSNDQEVEQQIVSLCIKVESEAVFGCGVFACIDLTSDDILIAEGGDDCEEVFQGVKGEMEKWKRKKRGRRGGRGRGKNERGKGRKDMKAFKQKSSVSKSTEASSQPQRDSVESKRDVSHGETKKKMFPKKSIEFAGKGKSQSREESSSIVKGSSSQPGPGIIAPKSSLVIKKPGLTIKMPESKPKSKPIILVKKKPE
ncbi:hypothetical protein ADUPG1_012102 [Aduncisulcus paluster]|uniref:SEC63 domain-containing protein n=1 Tax=Aduncisulcus paluster TaxID=2918883 RepID=A0ABQ5JYB7_9EUKA|nr:hypothetical protein ADUPG1_012102 [Aduncisulcus paluster]